MKPPPGVRAELEAIFGDALRAVDAGAAVRRALGGDAERLSLAGRRLDPDERVILLAAGKAAAPMAAAFESVAGERIVAGLAVTKRGHGVGLERVALREAAHPVPDASCEAAAGEALQLVERARPADTLVVLLSGGASSLLACPAGRFSLEDLALTTRLLLEAGAPIEELNVVRKHLAALAGGRLAQRAAARRIEVLAVSDVPGDRIDVIASGPCAADPSRFVDALDVLRKRGVVERVPRALLEHLEAGVRGELPETPGPDDPALARVRTEVLASNRDALEAARRSAERRGRRARLIAAPLEGEAREEGRRLAGLAKSARPGEPLLLLAGGETTVTVVGEGSGGRNQELALAAALELAEGGQGALLAAGTDGSDGPTPAAGAHADPGTVARGRVAGVEAREALSRNDSHGFFAAEGGLWTTGPTGTNVMDLALLALEPVP